MDVNADTLLRRIGLFGAGADGVAGGVFHDTVRFTGELDAGTLTV